MANTILVVCEHDGAAFKSTAFELCGKAKELGGDVVALVIGDVNAKALGPVANVSRKPEASIPRSPAARAGVTRRLAPRPVRPAVDLPPAPRPRSAPSPGTVDSDGMPGNPVPLRPPRSARLPRDGPTRPRVSRPSAASAGRASLPRFDDLTGRAPRARRRPPKPFTVAGPTASVAGVPCEPRAAPARDPGSAGRPR